MRIIWITSKLDFETAGGSVEEIDYIARTLAKSEDVTIITTHSNQNKITDYPGYKIYQRIFNTWNPFELTRSCLALLREFETEADVFIVDAHLYMYAAGLYRLLGGKTPVAGFVNQFMTCWPQHISSLFPQPVTSFPDKMKASLRWFLERTVGTFIVRHIDLLAYVSPHLRTVYEDFGFHRRNTDLVIGDPVDFDRLAKTASITDYTERTSTKPPCTLFYSSRMSPGKGFDILLQGFSLVNNKDDFRLIIGGTGPEEHHVKQMIKELELDKWVTLTGWVSKDELFSLYNRADVFIQADWWKAGTSISLIYALAFGVPSILPGGGGLQWLAGNSALYFPYRHPASLAECIEAMASTSLRKRLSRMARNRTKAPDMDYQSLIENFRASLQALPVK